MDRREWLKRVSVGAGSFVVAYAVLPSQWDRAKLQFGILPAHAGCSTGLVCQCCTIQTFTMTGDPKSIVLKVNNRSCAQGSAADGQLVITVSGSTISFLGINGAAVENVLNATTDAQGTFQILNATALTSATVALGFNLVETKSNRQVTSLVHYTVKADIDPTAFTVNVKEIATRDCVWP